MRNMGVVMVVFLLILAYLAFVYYKGAGSVVGATGSATGGLISRLQGFNAKGQQGQYPGTTKG